MKLIIILTTLTLLTTQAFAITAPDCGEISYLRHVSYGEDKKISEGQDAGIKAWCAVLTGDKQTLSSMFHDSTFPSAEKKEKYLNKMIGGLQKAKAKGVTGFFVYEVKGGPYDKDQFRVDVRIKFTDINGTTLGRDDVDMVYYERQWFIREF